MREQLRRITVRARANSRANARVKTLSGAKPKVAPGVAEGGSLFRGSGA